LLSDYPGSFIPKEKDFPLKSQVL